MQAVAGAEGGGVAKSEHRAVRAEQPVAPVVARGGDGHDRHLWPGGTLGAVDDGAAERSDVARAGDDPVPGTAVRPFFRRQCPEGARDSHVGRQGACPGRRR